MKSNLPDVYAFDRAIPKNKIMVRASPPPEEPRASSEVLDVKTGWNNVPVRLIANFAGWAPAGSAMRWDNGNFSVPWKISGMVYWRSFHSFDQTFAFFKNIPSFNPAFTVEAAE